MSTENSTTPHILVIDDEPAVCAALVDALEADGLAAGYATSAADALRQAEAMCPDLVVTDLLLPDGNGLELLGRLRRELDDLPAVIITGQADPAALAAATRYRPVELMTKPVNPRRLCEAVRNELNRQRRQRLTVRRAARLRQLVRRTGRQRRQAYDTLCRTCADLTSACRTLQSHIERQYALSGFQTDLIACRGEDDVFRRLFRLFVERTGPVFGVALLCDEEAELQLVGRFGVPGPDGPRFCQDLAMALVPGMLERPMIKAFDAAEELAVFPPHLHRYLVGVTVLAVPLMVGEGQMIGLVVLYRKGEQPFTEDDISLAGMIAPPTAAAVQRA